MARSLDAYERIGKLLQEVHRFKADVTRAVDALAEKVDTAIDDNRELHGEVREMRPKYDSVPEMVEEAVPKAVHRALDSQELTVWRARKEWALKVAATAMGGFILLVLGYWFAKLTGK